MNDAMLFVELPQFATLSQRLAHNIELARDAVSLRVGYEVELSGLEPIERDGHFHMRLYWRCRPLAGTA